MALADGPRRQRETCLQCGFDSDLYDRADTVSSQKVIAPVLAAAVEGLDERSLAARPDATTWSIVEYIDHVREVAFGNRVAIEVALASPGTDLGSPPPNVVAEQAKRIDVAAAIAGVGEAFTEMRKLLAGLEADQWKQMVILEGKEVPVGWFARHVLHDGLHHLSDIGRIRHDLGLGAKTEVGTVQHLSVSGGGVPKNHVDSVDIGPSGVAGDSQADRLHHGRPIQAVSIWSAEVIAVLQDEGHPIQAGSAGENITVSGVDWAALRPGSRLDIGPVSMFVSAHAVPCSKNAQWFSDGQFNRILHQNHPGSSRLYAIPLNSSRVSTGDAVTVEPAP